MPEPPFEQLHLPPTPEAPFEAHRAYWQHRAELIRDTHSADFDVFTHGHDALVTAGDQRMRGTKRTGPQATGYNLLLSGTDMTFEPEEEQSRIYYSMYLRRVEHLGILLATMISEDIIQPSQISFGVKASKAIPGDEWTPVRADESAGTIIQVQQGTGIRIEREVSKTVETIVSFAPESPANGEAIALFLSRRARRGAHRAIRGSFDIPDIRATIDLAPAFAQNAHLRQRFDLAQANVLAEPESDARLLILRKRTAFRDWSHRRVLLDKELAGYIVSALLGVRP